MLSVLLIIYAAVLHLSVFIYPVDWVPTSYGILAEIVYTWTDFNGYIPNILTIFLLFIQGFILNYLNLSHRLSNEVSLFPGLFFVLTASLYPDFLHFSPLHMANLFYLLALNDLMSVYNNQRSEGYIFNAGLWIGIGSLFYFSFIVFILLAFIALNVLRAFNIRERIMVLLGAITPYLLCALYFFWTDKLSYFLQKQLLLPYQVLDLSADPVYTSTYLGVGLFALLVLVVIFSYNRYTFKKVIQVQKKIKILFWGMLIAALSLLFQPAIQIDHLLILAVPVGLLLSINFIQLSKNWAGLFHTLLVLLILLLQFLPYWLS